MPAEDVKGLLGLFSPMTTSNKSNHLSGASTTGIGLRNLKDAATCTTANSSCTSLSARETQGVNVPQPPPLPPHSPARFISHPGPATGTVPHAPLTTIHANIANANRDESNEHTPSIGSRCDRGDAHPSVRMCTPSRNPGSLGFVVNSMGEPSLTLKGDTSSVFSSSVETHIDSSAQLSFSKKQKGKYRSADVDSSSIVTIASRLPDKPNIFTTDLSISLTHKHNSFRLAKGNRRLPQANHTPIPVTTIFARNAPPLFLPSLDDLLASFPAQTFSQFKPSKGYLSQKQHRLGRFPPMDHLAASGKSLKDLETNFSILPAWRNRSSILGAFASLALGATGSSALASFYSLHGLLDTVQVFALVLSTIVPRSGRNIEKSWKQIFMGTIPNVIALNFASTLVQQLLLLLILMAISSALLYYFYVESNRCKRPDSLEGHQSAAQRPRGWGLILVSFVLTILYLPLSTIAVHALVWSEDFWVVDNPYRNATSFPPAVPPLGPSGEFRDPLDFCYTTTMKRNEVNFAPLVVIVSVATCLFMTIWFPIRLRNVVMEALPKVDRFTELGQRRSQSDMDREYQRLLDRDRNPVAFLYNDFRRGWGTYKSFYLFAKLCTLLIVATIDPDNCFFRSLPRTRVSVVRQAVLVVVMLGFFLLQCFLAPFVDPVNNASEWTSRLNYVLTAAVGLVVALGIPGQSFFDGPVLYIIYILTYGLSTYFTLINYSWMHRVVKRLARRIDFSIDVFSPSLDTSPTSPHLKRRIWQEAISALFLTSPECKIPEQQPMIYAQAADSDYPPYLLNFRGSPGERHVENLKILREVGKVTFGRGVHVTTGGDVRSFGHLQDHILKNFIGPDCYWKPPGQEQPLRGCGRYFGNAWWIPFPPTLVMRYDDGATVVLQEMRDMHLYVTQNESDGVARKREIRMALRALDGRTVTWPYEHQQVVGARANVWCCRGRQYQAVSIVRFRSCALTIKRRGDLVWDDLQLGSGFDLELTYAKNVQVDGDAIGLTDDYELNPPLARFLSINQPQISISLPKLESAIQAYRDHQRRECQSKANALSYQFLTYAYDQPQNWKKLAERIVDSEKDKRVRQLMAENDIAFEASYERLAVAASSEIATWWYIFWDDLWRRNYDTISGLRVHAQDFDPHYPTSIAYTPVPRPILEAFLTQRGLLSKKTKWSDFFHAGFLNKIYMRINELAFHGSENAILYHLGLGTSEVELEDIDAATQARSSSLGVGGGTDHDDASIRARPNYRWEGILEDPLSKGQRHKQGWAAKFGVWFGVTPLWRTGVPSKGISLDVQLENGRYVLMEERQRTQPQRTSLA